MISLKEFFSSECKFIAGVANIEQIPNCLYMPEIAFAGRSNVGKSSLINAVVGSTKCARVSKTPGRTQQINFFSIKEKISLVDLPGYGYAEVSKSTRKAWDELIVNYLRGRANLKRVFLLIDSRHGIKPTDGLIMDILDNAAVVYQIVLTKIDKIFNVERAIETVKNDISNRVAAYPVILATSSEKNDGIKTLQSEIMSFL